jgi:hypothetical protein
MTRLLVFLVGAISLNAIDALGTDSDPVAQSCDNTVMTVKDWRNWTKVTQEPVRSKGHNYKWVRIYVNKLAAATYLSASSPYQVCAIIVKPIYTDSSGTNIRNLAIMVKMPPGYDPENADWWYGRSLESGINMSGGKLPECIICHKQAAATDYLFFKEVINAQKE